MFEEVFQTRIKKLCEECGYTVSEIAKKADISPASLHYYINGSRRPDARALYKLCSVFGVSSDWLLGLSDYRTTDNDLRTACLTLNINQDSATRIMQCDAIDTLFSIDDSAWKRVCELLTKYEILNLSNRKNTHEKVLDDGSVLLPQTKAAYYYAQMLGNTIAEGLVKQYNETSKMLKKLERDEKKIIDGTQKGDLPVWY